MRTALETAMGLFVLALCAIGFSQPSFAATVRVAVAANFTVPAEQIAQAFEAETGDDVVLSFGASGSLYAQISQGAPFDVFLSADMARPREAIAQGFGVTDTLFTYARGRLALYSPELDLGAGLEVLRAGEFAHLAIADRQSAPYGAAAVEVLEGLGIYAKLTGKIVVGQNVTQALQFVETGNAELGFVALSQVLEAHQPRVFEVPPTLYAPILQGAVLLNEGQGNDAALAFLAFLKGDVARAIIVAAGYDAWNS